MMIGVFALEGLELLRLAIHFEYVGVSTGIQIQPEPLFIASLIFAADKRPMGASS